MNATSPPVEVPDFLQPARTFDTATSQVLEYLGQVMPMGMWAVTRVVEGRQIMLEVKEDFYGFAAGVEGSFEDSPCHEMVSGAAPQIAPDAMAVPAYANSRVASLLPLGAYVGAPIVLSDGHLFGTVCGFNKTAMPDALRANQPLITLLSSLLSSVLEADHAAVQARRALEVVQVESETDGLTSLLNRRGWDRFIEVEEERFRRFGDQASVIVMDLDRLKIINDTQGHDAGDRYLQQTALVLKGSVRSGDVVARLGGDEFGMILPGAGSEAAARLVERMSAALEKAGISGSFGYAPITVVAGFPGAWKAADSAMYEEKRRRRAHAPGARAD